MANTIKFGTTGIADLKLGSSQVDKVYLGATQVWSKASPPPAEWPVGSEGEKAYYGGNAYTYYVTDAGHIDFIADTLEVMPYHVIYYTEDSTWHNGMGDTLPSNPTQTP